jgi:outer membrane protein TolC
MLRRITTGSRQRAFDGPTLSHESCSGLSLLPALVLLFLLPCLLLVRIAHSAEDGQAVGVYDVLTLSRAVDLALSTQPSLTGARYTVRASEARVGQARSSYFPQLNGSASYSRISPAATSGTTTLPSVGGTSAAGTGSGAAAIPEIIPTSSGTFDQYAGSVGLTQLVYDFGKTSTQVQINKLNTDAARFDLANVRQTVVLNVKQAYYNVLQAQRNAGVSRQSVKQFEQHLDQARSFLEVGTKSRFDVTKAEVDLSNARVNLISAVNQVRLAYVALKNAIGIPTAPDYKLEEALLYEPFGLSFEDALDQAYMKRPDLLAQIRRTESSRESITLARKGYFPAFTANGNYNYTGSSFPLQSGWSYGLNFSLPIFEGFLTQYQVSEAQSNFGVASASQQSLRLDIHSQVQQGYVNLRDAAERIKASELGVRQAKENVDLANGRYGAGVGSPLEVTDAIVAQSNAELTYSAALRDYKNAQAAIEKAIGAFR